MDFVFQRSYRGPLKAVIMDWAGTTVDFGCIAPVIAFVKAFQGKGIDITVEQARGPMGMHKRDHIAAIAALPGVQRQWTDRYHRAFSEADLDEIYREFIPLQLAVLPNHCGLIPGTLETVADFRRRGLKIGASTGYNAEMMAIVHREAEKRGYVPDCSANGSDVPSGRPYPWMCFYNAMKLGIYPMEAMVKIGDTVPDIEEGLNAGMWSIGVVMSGNEIGLNEEEIGTIDAGCLAKMRERAYDKLYQAGAHYVVDRIADVSPLLDWIETRLARGEKP